jgi:pantothenate synthetase
VNKLRHSGISTSRQAAVIRSMVEDLQRTIQILLIDICTEEERVQVFDKARSIRSWQGR